MSVKKKVPDDFYLYRRVSKDKCSPDDHGKDRVESTAFGDRHRQPSVDVASLLDDDPSRVPKLGPTDGVVCIKAGDVRKIGDVTTTTPGGPILHSVDVIYAPSKSNKAHALITVEPDFCGTNSAQKRAFKKLQIALARLANNNHPRFILEPK